MSLWNKNIQTFQVNEQTAELAVVGFFPLTWIQPMSSSLLAAAGGKRQLCDNTKISSWSLCASLLTCLQNCTFKLAFGASFRCSLVLKDFSLFALTHECIGYPLGRAGFTYSKWNSSAHLTKLGVCFFLSWLSCSTQTALWKCTLILPPFLWGRFTPEAKTFVVSPWWNTENSYPPLAIEVTTQFCLLVSILNLNYNNKIISHLLIFKPGDKSSLKHYL